MLMKVLTLFIAVIHVQEKAIKIITALNVSVHTQFRMIKYIANTLYCMQDISVVLVRFCTMIQNVQITNYRIKNDNDKATNYDERYPARFHKLLRFVRDNKINIKVMFQQ